MPCECQERREWHHIFLDFADVKMDLRREVLTNVPGEVVNPLWYGLKETFSTTDSITQCITEQIIIGLQLLKSLLSSDL